MSVFTESELAYLGEQRLARLATVGPGGTPHVTPVGFRLGDDGAAIEIGGANLTATRKFRDVARTGRAALVVDDLASVTPWRPRGLEVRGRAEAVESPPLIRVHPERIVSWGVNGPGRAGRPAR